MAKTKRVWKPKGKAKRTARPKTTKAKARIGYEIASCKTTKSGVANQFVVNKLYGFYNMSLQYGTRPIQVAEAYQYYRITHVEVQVKPKVDTFSASNSGGQDSSIPYLYWMIDKVGTFANTNMDFKSLREAGAKPIRFDEKTITLRYKPAVLIGDYDNGVGQPVFRQKRISPWLSTNRNNLDTTQPWSPDGTDHLGIMIGVEQEGVNSETNPLYYDIDITVHYQFKKPRNMTLSPNNSPLVMVDCNLEPYPEGGNYQAGLS